MGTGWRRAFCTTIPRGDREAVSHQINTEQINNQETSSVTAAEVSHSQCASPAPLRSCAKLSIFSSISNPSTPRTGSSHHQTVPTLRCKTTAVATPQSADNTPRVVQCHVPEKTSTFTSSSSLKKSSSPSSSMRRKKMGTYSNPSSPRSPFTILRNTLRLSKSSCCGVCLQSVKTGQGMAIYTAECSHSFHFPCISQHVRKQGSLICPICHITWKDVPLLSAAQKTTQPPQPPQDEVVEKTITTASMTTNTTPKTYRSLSDSSDRRNVNPSSTPPVIRTTRVTSDDTMRPFTDDEPLLPSPTAGARFNPIPEVDEADDETNGGGGDDVEEFKGFFVNTTPSAPVTPTKKLQSVPLPFPDHRSRTTHRNVEVKLLPESAVISIGRSHETFAVALRVKAPPPPQPSPHGGNTTSPLLSPSHRASIDLVVVLDTSSTMSGAKLQMMKRAMRLLISSLGPTDRLSIVAFSSSPAQRLLPLRRMTAQGGQRLARRIIDQLSTSKGKCVSEALKMAAKVLEDRREKNPVASIILLSDGQDEDDNDRSVTNQKKQSQQHHGNNNNNNSVGGKVSLTRFGHVEIPVNSLGYSGGGTSLADSFAKQVGGLLSVVVQDLRIQLGFASGSAPAEIIAVYSCNGRPTLLNSDSIRLGDLYAEEERELLVEVRVPTSTIGSHQVMSVRCSYTEPSSQELVYGRERALLVPRPHAIRSSDPRIERMRNVFIATRAVAESRRLLEHSEFGSAQQLLLSARGLLAQSTSASAGEYVRWLESELAEVNWGNRRQKEEEAAAAVVVGRSGRGNVVDENGEPLTPTSAWRAAERLAKVAMMKKSMNRASDLHGFESARF